ncbi:hypothetical protein D4764_04G0001440 [Takifugu flavidus]|uniref:Uncharacterized protein n=1 Tax=Takifugu flavidus TaxID=433684 RepID=A0A5C6N6Z8_9TELE|nr:hypothetical protein D4764_04G0001440 [Takifugu flavidus]
MKAGEQMSDHSPDVIDREHPPHRISACTFHFNFQPDLHEVQNHLGVLRFGSSPPPCPPSRPGQNIQARLSNMPKTGRGQGKKVLTDGTPETLGLCERLSGVDEGAEGARSTAVADDPGHQTWAIALICCRVWNSWTSVEAVRK